MAGYEGLYEVSATGLVRSYHALRRRILRPVVDRDGYGTVLLYGRHGRQRHKIHRLVCAAFHGPEPEGCEVGHLDGNPGNNRAENLKWVTRSENTRHSIEHGTYQPRSLSGENHPAAKLSAQSVTEIRRLAAEGKGPRGLARQYGIAPSQVHRIIQGERWANV